MYQDHALNVRNQTPKEDCTIKGDTETGMNLASFI